ncbi:selenium-binding protein SBP56-related protein [Micromonospora sp. WMMD987]|uniref:selenium-binding protein SBP56-related protein n=1 Tax=Micromonospora sp. WMMD987 TaxID=3016089 RepID=UPI00249C83EC|nr:selenium-binding protein SBP56-related protein [Micromonospora sp. WMMD987]WFE97865.1 selenium-binding protein SBP56-related protein [Micromonospora sp. WMMD987]
MTRWTPDPSFYPSPREASTAPAEKLAYVAAFDRTAQRPDAIVVLDTDPESADYGRVVGWTDLPDTGDEVHHFGWNACSSALCPTAPHPHVERRYLIVPGLRSSRIHVFDTRPDPRAPQLVKVIGAEELAGRAGYSRPHTVHCGPDGIYLSALGGVNAAQSADGVNAAQSADGVNAAQSADGVDAEGPGGIVVLDHTTFDVRGAWEADRGPQFLAYDVWWHLTQDVLVTSEWGTPSMIEDGIVGELLLGRKYGHAIHFWDLAKRRHVQRVDLGDQYQMPLELRPAHDPTQSYGFVGVVISVEDLSASVWLWHRDGAGAHAPWAVTKVIDIPAEPADPADLPELLKPFGAVPPLVTDIDLSVDDRFLYVSCWGTGELRQYDVRDPFHPVLVGSVRLGGIVARTAHPAAPGEPLAGGPQMVEVSRDGRRVYVSNSLYGSWDDQFYPDGVGAWLAKLDVDPEHGGLTPDERFFPHGEEFRGLRVHQTRLQGGDASSDSYCFP